MSKLSKVEKCIEKGKVDELIKLTQDKDMQVRLAAVAGLGKMPDGDNVCNALIGMMNDPAAEIRAACATALGQLKDNRADTFLRYHMEHEKDETVIAAMHDALGMLHHR